jgi:hypothetical protein
MKKLLYVWLLLLCCTLTEADFEGSELVLHPAFPRSGPFILEVAGTWPTDCHPGEQKPVISSYDAASVAITFEIIVVHVTCNSTPTPYRVLVDMSGLAGTFTGGSLQVRLEFGGAVDDRVVRLICSPATEPERCPGGRPVRRSVQPDSGLYFAAGLDKQGLLLARQQRSLAAYPLVYDESGRAQWLFSGSGILGDVFFGELYAFSGGQCLECPLPDAPPTSNLAGHLTVLFDSPHEAQVKFNDQLFVSYRALNFGYGVVAQDNEGEGLVDLSGKWAVSWLRPPHDLPGESTPPGEPLVFEIWPLAPDGPTPGMAAYVVIDLAGREMARISCNVADAIPCVWHKQPGFWESGYWDYGEGEDIPLAILSHRRIGFVLVGEQEEVKAEAVRLD